MITVTVYPKKRNTPATRPSWGLRIQAANGRILGHSYNDPADAEHAADLIFGEEEVVLKVVDENGDALIERRLR